MSVLFMDGFDWTTTGSDILRKYEDGGTSYNPVSGRFSGNALQLDGSSYIRRSIGDSITTVCVGIAQRINETGGSYNVDVPFIGFMDASNVKQVGVYWNGNDLQVRRGDGTLLQGVSSIRLNTTWVYWEFKAYIHATTGTILVKRNEQVVVNLTNQNTKNGTDYIKKVMIRDVYASQNTYYDDFYITDGDVLGDCRVHTLFPDSDETYSQFTRSGGSNNYEMVDEDDPDDDSTYVDGSVKGLKDSYGVTPSIVGEIKAVQVSNMVRKTGSEGVIVKNLIRSNSTDYPSTEEKVLTPEYKTLVSIHNLDPGDSGAWTNAKLTAAEFGLQITGITTTTTT